VLQRSGRDEDAGRYISFCSEGRTLDVELPTPEAREFVFKKFADLFQAYATAQIERLQGDAANLRVAAIVDGGAPSKPGSTRAPPAPAPAPAPLASQGPGGQSALQLQMAAAARLAAAQQQQRAQQAALAAVAYS